MRSTRRPRRRPLPTGLSEEENLPAAPPPPAEQTRRAELGDLFCLPKVQMSKTDRQTDKSTWWSLTAFNSEILIVEDKSQWPDFVKSVHGGREECPTSNKEHFQGAVQCHRQVRMSQLKKWLPTAHWEIPRSVEALKRYVMKTETATGEKVVRESEQKYYKMHDLLYKLGDMYTLCRDEIHKLEDAELKDLDNKIYWYCVAEICRVDPELISSYSIPAVKTAWINTKSVWLEPRPLVLQALATRDSPVSDVSGIITDILNGSEHQNIISPISTNTDARSSFNSSPRSEA